MSQEWFQDELDKLEQRRAMRKRKRLAVVVFAWVVVMLTVACLLGGCTSSVSEKMTRTHLALYDAILVDAQFRHTIQAEYNDVVRSKHILQSLHTGLRIDWWKERHKDKPISIQDVEDLLEDVRKADRELADSERDCELVAAAATQATSRMEKMAVAGKAKEVEWGEFLQTVEAYRESIVRTLAGFATGVTTGLAVP